MKIIVLEDKVYKVSEKHFKALKNKQEEINNKPYYQGSDVDMDNFIDTLKPLFKCLGCVEFDFRL